MEFFSSFIHSFNRVSAMQSGFKLIIVVEKKIKECLWRLYSSPNVIDRLLKGFFSPELDEAVLSFFFQLMAFSLYVDAFCLCL